MSVADDDDFWENDEFIATIENVVKKAEEASAAKHGTQSVGTPASISVQTVTNSRSVGGPVLPSPASRQETLTLQETFNVRATNGSSAPGQEFSRNSGHTISVGNGKIKQGGSNGFQPLYQQQGQTPVQFKNYENGPFVHEEGLRYRELLAEKDGAISVLRSRVRQAEQQLDEMRKRTSLQTTSHPPLHQQRELERLTSQVMFKDHEISEAQRARAEKEELLMNALAETAALKEELERLKKSRGTVAESKRPRDEDDAFVPEKISECSGFNIQEETPISDTLQVRTVADGCVSSDGRRASTATKVQGSYAAPKASKPHGGRDILETLDAGTTVGTEGGCSSVVEELERLRMSEMYYALQQLWGFKGANRDGMAVVSKVYATCPQDLYILLSEEGSRYRNPDSGKDEWTATMSEKLHTALAKVSSGFTQPEILLPVLMEFCRVDNANLVGSALRVLRCILHVDSSCRQKLLAKQSPRVIDHDVRLRHSDQSLGKMGDGLLVTSAHAVTSSDQTSQVPLFSSRRIVFQPQALDKFGNRDVISKDIEEGGSHLPDQIQQSDLRQKEVTSAGDCETFPPVEENLLVKWMLHLALTSSSQLVKFEAVALIGLLVVNSEPAIERASFEHLLHPGGVELLLKESCGVEIQLQSIRIVHLLLHCPVLFPRFLVLAESHQTAKSSAVLNDNDKGLAIHALEVQAGKNPDCSGKNHDWSVGQRLETCNSRVTPALQQSSHPVSKRARLLDGITECLKHAENNLHGHALHRSAIRLLAFMAASGDSGASLLTQNGVSYDDTELGTPWKIERENASGQQVVGDGSDLIHVKGLDVGDRGNGILSGGDDEVAAKKLAKEQTIPQRLVVLISAELDIEEMESRIEPSLKEERDSLVHEALSLLCQLSSTKSSEVVRQLISSKAMARLTISAMNRLIRSKSDSSVGNKSSVPRSSDTAELARGLRGKVLRSLAESGELV